MVKFDNFFKVVKFPPSFFSTFIWRSNLSFSFNGLFAQPQVTSQKAKHYILGLVGACFHPTFCTIPRLPLKKNAEQAFSRPGNT